MKGVCFILIILLYSIGLRAADPGTRHPDLVLLDIIKIGMELHEVEKLAGVGGNDHSRRDGFRYYGGIPHNESWHTPVMRGSIEVKYRNGVVIATEFWRGTEGYWIPDVIDVESFVKGRLQRIDEQDRSEKPRTGQILLLGDDFVLRWDKAAAELGNLDVIARGMETLRLVDLLKHVDRLAVHYRPKLLVISVGENDIRSRAKPQEVLDRTKKMLMALREKLPQTKVILLSIKPNPMHPQMLEYIRQANELIAAELEKKGEVLFVNTFSKLIDSSGFPIGTFFLPCGACLNESGMKIVNEELKKALSKTGFAP